MPELDKKDTHLTMEEVGKRELELAKLKVGEIVANGKGKEYIDDLVTQLRDCNNPTLKTALEMKIKQFEEEMAPKPEKGLPPKEEKKPEDGQVKGGKGVVENVVQVGANIADAMSGGQTTTSLNHDDGGPGQYSSFNLGAPKDPYELARKKALADSAVTRDDEDKMWRDRVTQQEQQRANEAQAAKDKGGNVR